MVRTWGAGPTATMMVLAAPWLMGGCSSSGASASDAGSPADGAGDGAQSEIAETGGLDEGEPETANLGMLPEIAGPSDAGDDAALDGAAADGDGIDAPPDSESAGVFVAVGYGGRRARSLDDGVTWVDDVALMENGTDDQTLLRAVGWGAQGFLAVGYHVMASSDGKTWVDHGVPLNQWLGSVVAARGRYVAVGGFGLRVSSADGVTWQRNGIDNIAAHAGSGLVFTDQSGGAFVSANDSGRRSRSADGISWSYSTGADASKTTLLAFGNGIGVGVGGTDVVITTDGGMTWTAAPALAVAAQSLVFARGRFTAVAVGHVLNSTDARAWTDQAVAGVGGNGLAYGHGAYLLVDNSGGLRRSTDTTTWTPVLARGNNGFSWVTFGASPAMANPKTE